MLRRATAAAPRRAIATGNAVRCHAHDGTRVYAAPRRAIAVWRRANGT